MKNNIKVSVIVPAYNVEKYLDTCIKSILEQTEKDIELILINDKSIDNTEKIIKKWTSIDSRIKVIENSQNVGVSASRNIGIENSRGEYIIFVDSDDWIDEDMIKSMYLKAMEYNTSYVRCLRIREILDRNRKICQGINFDRQYIQKSEFSRYVYPEILNTYNFNSACIGLIKREIIVKNNIKFNENYNYAEDYQFNLEVISKLDNMAIISKPYYHYRVNDNSITVNKNSQNIITRIDSAINMYSELYKYLKKWGIDTPDNNFIVKNRILKEVMACTKRIFRENRELSMKDKINILKYSMEKLENLKLSYNIKDYSYLDATFLKKKYKFFIIIGSLKYTTEYILKYNLKRVIALYRNKWR